MMDTVKRAIGMGVITCLCMCLMSCGKTASSDGTVTESTTITLGSSPGDNVVINDTLSQPASIVADADGNFYVADTKNNQIVKMDKLGNVLLTYGSEGSGKGEFHFPKGLAIDGQGYIWVADMNNDRIVRFNPTSRTTFTSSFWSFGSFGNSSTQFKTPLDITVRTTSTKHYVHVVDSDNSRVQIIPITLSTGMVDTPNIMTWAPDTSAYGKVASLCFGDDGFLYATRKKGVVEKYSPQLTVVPVYANKRYSVVGSAISDDPGDILVQDGKLYVADHKYNKVHVYKTDTTELLESYGTSGTSQGMLSAPISLCVTSGLIYVVEEYNDRVQSFKPD